MCAYAEDLSEVLLFQHAELGIEQLSKRLGTIQQVLLPLVAEPLRHEVFIALAQQRGFVHHSLFIPSDVQRVKNCY